MKKILLLLLLISSTLWAQETYKLNGTEYYKDLYYTTTGYPMVKRSEAAKREFLALLGYAVTPYGYEIDHIIPLSEGGADIPENMQLLTAEDHRRKTAEERKDRYYSYNQYNFKPRSPQTENFYDTYEVNSIRPKTTYNPAGESTYTPQAESREIKTGPRGGQYYINSNGNKTYIKKS